MGLFRCLVLLSMYLTATTSEEWCYQSQKCAHPECQEPRNWVQVDSQCGGKSQSPININTNKAETDWNLVPFHFQNYDTLQHGNWIIKNNGHTVQVDLDGSAKIACGDLPGLYRALQFHFHWGHAITKGHDMSPGSEHIIDGEQYAMELHVVHIKDEYKDIPEAAAKKGLAVLGFFIKIGNENKYYDPLILKLSEISSSGSNTSMEPLPLFSLLPKVDHLTKYYRYSGSLTTPGCNEGVIWTLFEEPIQLSLAQAQEFVMKLYFDKDKTLPMEDNFRPVQPLGDRIVFKSDSSAPAPLAKTLLLLPAASYLLLSWTQ